LYKLSNNKESPKQLTNLLESCVFTEFQIRYALSIAVKLSSKCDHTHPLKIILDHCVPSQIILTSLAHNAYQGTLSSFQSSDRYDNYIMLIHFGAVPIIPHFFNVVSYFAQNPGTYRYQLKTIVESHIIWSKTIDQINLNASLMPIIVSLSQSHEHDLTVRFFTMITVEGTDEIINQICPKVRNDRDEPSKFFMFTRALINIMCINSKKDIIDSEQQSTLIRHFLMSYCPYTVSQLNELLDAVNRKRAMDFILRDHMLSE